MRNIDCMVQSPVQKEGENQSGEYMLRRIVRTRKSVCCFRDCKYFGNIFTVKSNLKAILKFIKKNGCGFSQIIGYLKNT